MRLKKRAIQRKVNRHKQNGSPKSVGRTKVNVGSGDPGPGDVSRRATYAGLPGLGTSPSSREPSNLSMLPGFLLFQFSPEVPHLFLGKDSLGVRVAQSCPMNRLCPWAQLPQLQKEETGHFIYTLFIHSLSAFYSGVKSDYLYTQVPSPFTIPHT